MRQTKIDLNSVNFLTLSEVSAQDVFDKVATHMMTQKRKAIADDLDCCYRTTDEFGNVLRCAAGCLIPDELYDPDLEGTKWKTTALRLEEKVGRERLADCHSSLIRSLQVVHDGQPLYRWKEKLAELAVKFNLNSDILDNFEDLPFDTLVADLVGLR